MARIEQSLVTRLEAVSGVTNLISTRIYPNKLPQNTTYPATVYQGISRPTFDHLNGNVGVVNVRFQITTWADDTPTTARDVGEEIRKALEGFSGTVSGIRIFGIRYADASDEYDDDTELHGYRQDFRVMYCLP